MKIPGLLAAACLLLLSAGWAPAQSPPAPLSEKTQACLECHREVTPGIVADWQRSRMARTTPARALQAPELKRRISVRAGALSPELMKVAVGCAECHTMRPGEHPDTFDHEGEAVHTVVTPPDCAVCHPVEESQYQENLMSRAWVNFTQNPLYQDLAAHINGVRSLDEKGRLQHRAPTPGDSAEACLYCHGTEVKVIGKETREVGDYGEMSFPKLSGWPNRGAGRKNPDQSLGSCTACHTRHQFAMHLARQPQTCAQCHKGPDVPAYKVYQVSKHGNIYNALKGEWDFKSVPWTVGRDFTAPTCAACHASLLVDGQGQVLARRSHKMADRIWVRLLGLVYSHPHPADPDTSIIKSPDGLNLPTALDGRLAKRFLITPAQQAKRRSRMEKVCLSCHSTQWVRGQLGRLEDSIRSSDAMVASATGLLARAWKLGLAQGPAQGSSPFDEYIESLWVAQWLFYANSTRLASAMMGADLGVFENGRWSTATTLAHMQDWLRLHSQRAPQRP